MQPVSSSRLTLACCQCDVAFGDPLANAAFAASKVKALAAQSVDLILFPEAFLTGYCFRTAEEASAHAIERSHEAIRQLQEAVDASGTSLVAGFAERSEEGLFNSAALLAPGIRPRLYRKTHLPFLGLDRFVKAGSALEVHETPWGPVGVLICFDMRPPEATRTLALQGAELILLPTNWPEGAEVSADFVSIARAAENKVFFASCNRVGEEQGFRFIGRSKIISPTGKVLAAASDGPEDLIAEIDLAEARNKHSVLRPGEYELQIFEKRRPELYHPIVD